MSRQSSARREVLQLLKACEDQGWTVEKTGSGHWKATSPSGAVVFVPQTPSDKRAVLNVRAQLRRAGLPRDAK